MEILKSWLMGDQTAARRTRLCHVKCNQWVHRSQSLGPITDCLKHSFIHSFSLHVYPRRGLKPVPADIGHSEQVASLSGSHKYTKGFPTQIQICSQFKVTHSTILSFLVVGVRRRAHRLAGDRPVIISSSSSCFCIP